MDHSRDHRILIDNLGNRALHVNQLLESLELLEEDLRFINPQESKIDFCVDFFDLRKYLDWIAPDSFPNAQADSRSLTGYVYVLLFLFFPQPLVLLPWYYREFVSHVRGLAFHRPHLVSEREHWLSILRRRLDEEVRSPGGLLSQLSDLVSSDAVVSEAHIGDISKRISDLLYQMSTHMNQNIKAISFIERFNYLQNNERVIGLKHIIEPGRSVDFEDDPVYHFCFSHLRTARPEREDIVNDNDSKAISMIYQINSSATEKQKVLYLISSAPAMKDVVDLLNENEIVETGKVNLRDINYWNLWFSIAMQNDSENGIPSLADVRMFKSEFSSVLRELAGDCNRLKILLDTSDAPEKYPLDLSAANGILIDLEGLLRRISRPILDGHWLSATLSDAFMPVAHEQEFAEKIGQLNDLLGRLRRSDRDLASIHTRLDTMLEDLDGLVGSVEDHFLVEYSSLTRSHPEYFGNWRFKNTELSSKCQELLQRIETRGLLAANEVLEEIREVSYSEDDAHEWLFLKAVIFLLRGQPGKAEYQLSKIDDAHGDRPDVMMARAKVLEDTGRLQKAEKILRTLEARYEDPVIRLQLASLFTRRFGTTRQREDLEEAWQNIVLARNGSTSSSLRLRTEILISYYDIMILEHGRDAVRSTFEEARRELSGIVKEWNPNALPPELNEIMVLVLGQIATKLASSEG